MRTTFHILLFFVSSLGYAQNLFLPLANEFNSNFTKRDNSWDWSGRFVFQTETDNSLGVKIIDIISTELREDPRDKSSTWRDNNKLKGYIFYKSPLMYNGIYFDSWILRDQTFTNKITTGKSQDSNVSAGFKANYLSIPRVSIIPHLGYQRSEKRFIIDYGWDIGLEAKLLKMPLGSYQTDALLQTDFDFFPERQNSAHNIDLRINAQFSPLTRDSLVLIFSENNQEYFQEDFARGRIYVTQNEIEKKSLYNYLFYSLTARSVFELHTELSSENIFDDSPGALNQRDELKIKNRINYRWRTQAFSLLLGLHTAQETQDNLGILTDSKSLETALNTDIIVRPTIADQIGLNLSFVKYQYETPDSIINNTDRDAIRFIGQLNYWHSFSSLLKIELEFYTWMFHTIYILEEQSANNYWNRIYRLSAVINYRWQKFRNWLKTAILADYNTYDFEEAFDQIPSYVVRKYLISDSLYIPLIKDFALGFYGYLELNDRGTFFKHEFEQFVFGSGQVLLCDAFLQKKNLFYLTFDAGLAIYQEKRWRHIPRKYLDREINMITPYIRIIYPLNPYLRFRAYISLTKYKETGGINRSYANGNLMLVYNF